MKKVSKPILIPLGLVVIPFILTVLMFFITVSNVFEIASLKRNLGSLVDVTLDLSKAVDVAVKVQGKLIKINNTVVSNQITMMDELCLKNIIKCPKSNATIPFIVNTEE